jgi:hypothetical protein
MFAGVSRLGWPFGLNPACYGGKGIDRTNILDRSGGSELDEKKKRSELVVKCFLRRMLLNKTYLFDLITVAL